jgi:hypothetical protein
MLFDKKDQGLPLTIVVSQDSWGRMLVSSGNLFAVDQLFSIHQRLHVVDNKRLWWWQKK